MIPQSFIQDLLNRVDIVELINRHVPLRRAGANYSACCPFHNEKSPSFTVSPTKQFYHCFGCGAHGTAISFLMEHQGLDFIDAVNELARSMGLVVPQEGGRSNTEQRTSSHDLGEILLQAANWYRSRLKTAQPAIDYLKKRGLTGEIAKRYGIGFAPDEWQGLAQVFDSYAESHLLAEAGLVIDNENGRRYDRFRNRVMFPILNHKGSVIGFGGRIMESGEPKYLNSPETPLFEKGRELYGLFQARRGIRDADQVLVVEGYMDVVALAQFGVDYAVATLGTATTPVHVQKLLRLTDNVIFCFDGDDAGRRAAWRALENSLEQLEDGKKLSFLFLPQGEDPDSYIRQHGKEAFEKLLGEALPLSQFMLRELTTRTDMGSEEGRARFIKSAQPLLEKISAPALHAMLKKRIGELAGLTQESAAPLLGRVRPPGPQQTPAAERSNFRPTGGRRAQLSLPRQLLDLLLLRPRLADQIDPALLAGGGTGAEAVAAREVVQHLRQSPAIVTAAPVMQAFADAPFLPLLESALRSTRLEEFGDDELQLELDGLLQRMQQDKERQERHRKLGELSGTTRDLSPEQKQLLQQTPPRDAT